MAFPTPVPGLVIRYAYLWRADHDRGREEGVKDRPCAVLLSVIADAGKRIVLVLPITHTPPTKASGAIEIPANTKRRLGLDDQRSWIVLTENNRFVWPGPDLRPIRPGDASSIVYGTLPRTLFEEVRTSWLALYRSRGTHVVARTE